MSHIIWFIRIGKRFRLIECDVFSCSSYGNDIVFCQVNQFYIQGHDMLIKPPAKPIDFRSLLIIYYSNDIYRSNQIVGTSIFSAQIRNYDVAVMRTLVMTSLIVQLSWQHKVHFNYLKSLNSTFFLNNAECTDLIPLLNPSLSQFFEAIGSNRIYIFIQHTRYQWFTIRFLWFISSLRETLHAAPLVIDWWSLIYHS